MLKINPFFLLIIFYLIINLVFAVIGFNNNYVEIELLQFKLKSESFFIAFLLQFLIILLILIIYCLFEFKDKEEKKLLINNKYAYFILMFQIFFMVYNLYYGTNIAGASIQSPNPILNIFFVLLPIDIFFILFAPYIKSKKMFWLNSIIYIISNTLRGWMGAILLLFFVYLCRKKYIYISLKSSILYLSFFIGVFLLIPILGMFKWGMRNKESLSAVLNNIELDGYRNLLLENLSYVFNRFQHNYHVALIFENYERILTYKVQGVLLPYWAEGVIQAIGINVLNITDLKTLGQIMVVELFSSTGDWNSNPGLAGWLIISEEYFLIFVIYVSVLLSLSFLIARKFYDKKMYLIFSVFSVFYLFHGWIGMFFNLMFYAFIFALIKRVRV